MTNHPRRARRAPKRREQQPDHDLFRRAGGTGRAPRATGRSVHFTKWLLHHEARLLRHRLAVLRRRAERLGTGEE